MRTTVFQTTGAKREQRGKTNLRDNRIRIHNQNDLTNSYRFPITSPRFPPAPRLLEDLLQSHIHRLILQAPETFPIGFTSSHQLLQVLLELETQLQPVIHIGRLLKPTGTLEPVRVV